MEYIIKKLTAADLSLAKSLIALWHTEDGKTESKIPRDEYLQKLLSQDTFHVFVAMQEEHVIGGLTAYELPMFDTEIHEMFLYEIGVNEKHREKGLATKLVNALKKTCGDKEIKIIFVASSFENAAARQLYQSTGAQMEEIPWFTYNLEG